jgi:hypothetical protein
MKREISAKVGFSSIALAILLIMGLRAGCGLLGGTDDLAGYYAVKINDPPADATQDQVQQTGMLLGMDRLALRTNHQFRFGPLRGNWSHSGSKLTLEATTKPEGLPYPNTTMAQALSILLKPADFTVGSDGKTLTADKPVSGPVVFVKLLNAL